MANSWGPWVALIGGIISVIGQWWGTLYYLPLIGGIVAIIGAIGGMAK